MNRSGLPDNRGSKITLSRPQSGIPKRSSRHGAIDMGLSDGPEREPVARSHQDSEEKPGNDIAQCGCEQGNC